MQKRIDRLARREERDILKRILVLSVISVVIIIILFTAGSTFLGKFADFVSIFFKGKTQASGSENVFVQPPVVDSVPTATNSASLKLTGFAADGAKVEVYADDNKLGESKIDGGRFEYSDITLKNGENDFRVKAVNENGVSSDFSQVIRVSFDKREPQLTVSSPTDGQNFSGDNNRIKVEGTTEKDAQVFANGFLANVGSDGKFDVNVPLVDGDNKLEVKAIDEAGNTKIVTVKVSYHK